MIASALVLSACSKSFGPGSEPEISELQAATAEPPAHPGEAPYIENCAACHDQAVYKAPSRTFLAMMGAGNILHAMQDGLMQIQAQSLTDAEKRAVAEYLSGQSLADMTDPPAPPACDGSSEFDATAISVSRGWGVSPGNPRFQPAESGGLTVEDAPDLEVKWAFAYPNAIYARSQPAYGGGAIYFGGPDGTVRALDAKTGCLRWTFKATAEVRTAVVISPWSAGDETASPVLYFGDIIARAYALNARTGELIWMTRIDDHPDATITGTPALHSERVYFPVSSLEVVPAMNPQYACCTFRGSVVALDASRGDVVWKTYTIDEPPSVAGQNREGTDILAPSGAPVWTSPTIDVDKGRLYVGTGENYSSPADGNSDAIIAMDLKTGEKLWVSQQTPGDAWNTGCLVEYTTNDANCPEENGPDYDFGSSPMLLTLDDGTDVLIGGQKSGAVMAIDPDSGETLWRTQVGRGGVQGGIHFGMAAEGQFVYVPINDMAYPEDVTRYKFKTPPRPGMFGLDAASGEVLWSTLAEDVCAGRENCDPGISHAVTAIPGAVIAGHLDGRLRVYSRADGSVLWELDTAREFETVSGATAMGGAFSGGGAIVADGMIYLNSGYGLYRHMPGNVLLAIGKKTDQN